MSEEYNRTFFIKQPIKGGIRDSWAVHTVMAHDNGGVQTIRRPNPNIFVAQLDTTLCNIDTRYVHEILHCQRGRGITTTEIFWRRTK
jgi:hypothetical protein